MEKQHWVWCYNCGFAQNCDSYNIISMYRCWICRSKDMIQNEIDSRNNSFEIVYPNIELIEKYYSDMCSKDKIK